MADEKTRTEVVTEHIEAVLAKYGDENWVKLLGVCIQDISVSLATLVDNSSSGS